MKNELHIWELNPIKIYLFLEKHYRKELIVEALNKTKELQNSKTRNKYLRLSAWLNLQSTKYRIKRKVNTSDVLLWLIAKRKDNRTNKIHVKCMPLWVCLELIYLTKGKLENLENNILFYRWGGKGTPIKNPKFPIKVNVELDSIVINLMCDGAVSDTPTYFNTNEEFVSSFIKRVKNCFGNFEYKTYENGCQVRIPSLVAHIIRILYGVKYFGSYECRIPKRIFGHDQNNRLASLITFIADEGSISDITTLYSNNRNFLNDAKKLAESLDFKTNPIHPHTKNDPSQNEFYFTISNKTAQKFANDYIMLRKKIPTITMGNKFENLIKIISS